MASIISRAGERVRVSATVAMLASAAFLTVGVVQAQASFLGYRTQVGYVTPNNQLKAFMPRTTTEENNSGERLVGENVDAGTNPSASGWNNGVTESWDFAWASGGGVWTSQPSVGPHAEGLGMAPNTSPGVNIGSGFAFQANTTNLWINHTSTAYGMAAGTSPAISASGVVAFQANNGELWIYGGGSAFPTHLGMFPGTSPSVVDTPTGWTVAFHASGNGQLWTYSSNGATVQTGDGMETGTSPSIAYCGGALVVVFEASGSRDLWTYSPGVGTDRKAAMQAGTSPSIACRAGASWEAAFHGAQNNRLETYSPLTGTIVTGDLMRQGSSPSIAE